MYFFRPRLIRLNPKVTMTLILENANKRVLLNNMDWFPVSFHAARSSEMPSMPALTLAFESTAKLRGREHYTHWSFQIKLKSLSDDLWWTIELIVGLLKYFMDFHAEGVVPDGEGRTGSAKRDAFKTQLAEEEDKVGNELATIRKDIDQAEEAMSTASKGSVNRQGYLNNQSQNLSTKKAQLQALYDKLSKSTEQCRKVELRYSSKNIVTGVESTRGHTIDEVLESRPESPELHIHSLNSCPNSYASWAE